MSDATPVDLRRQGTPKNLESPDVEAPHADTSLAGEYDAATTRVGLADRSDLGRLRVTGTDAIAIRKRSLFSLAYDHRIVDGADAARFLSALKDMLQSFPEDA